MGDRAVIVVTDGEEIGDAALYLHWADGAKGCGLVIGHTLRLMVDCKGDVPYFTARMIAVACGAFRGTTGVGVLFPPDSLPPSDDYTHGDCGVIVVDVSKENYGAISTFHGYLSLDSDDGNEVDCRQGLLREVRNLYPEARLSDA